MFPTTLTDLWTLTASSIKTEAVRLALDSALFDQLAKPSTVEQFALRQQWEPHQATALLELLWSMKLLTRDTAGYQTSAEMQAYLCQTGERYIGDSWRFRYQSLRDVGQQLAWMPVGRRQRKSRLRKSKENIIAAGLHQRLITASGDFSTQPFAAGYADIIWCSSFLHFVEDITTSIAQLFNALTPGSVLVAVHAKIASNQEDAASVLPLYLPLMLRGRRVTRERELASLLCDAGFSLVETRRHQPFPMSPLTVLIARK